MPEEDSAHRQKEAGFSTRTRFVWERRRSMEKLLVAIAAVAVGIGAILAGVAARRKNYFSYEA